MSLFTIFIHALFEGNLVTWNAVGLGMIVLFSYTMKEAIMISFRLIFFILLQIIIMLSIRSFFNFPGKEIFLVIFLIGTEVLLGPIFDFLIPESHLEQGLTGFIRRGDAILPLVLAIIISQRYNNTQSLVYGLGLGMGFIFVLLIITAISEKFSFSRLRIPKTYVLKLLILGILLLIFS